MEKTSTSTSWDRAQQLFNKNIELEKKRQKSLQARIPSDPNTWNQIRENSEAIILEDHAFSEKHNIEFSLWQLHYKRIEEFRAHFSAAQASARSSAANNSKAPLQPDRVTKIRMQFKAFLSEATGFYHDLILKIRAKYGLPLGHFSDNSDNLAIVGDDATKSSDIKKALVSCHRCLIYLGDLARYKGLYGDGESRAREYSAASSYYLQAASLWPSNGNPHHQLAILAAYASDELGAVYRYFRSLAVEVPFPTAKDNLVIAFEKNRQSYNQLLETTKDAGKREASIKEKYKDFCNRFVRLHGILFSRTSLETFPAVLASVTEVLHELLPSGPKEQQNFGRDGTENAQFVIRLAALLIFTVYNVNKKTEGQTYAEILQHNVLYENACTVTFELMGLIVERCLQLDEPSSSFLLPGILVFLEWLACCPNVAACAIDEKKITAAKMSFWKHCIALLNKLLSCRMVLVDDGGDETCFTNMSRFEEGETDSRLALGEDFELRGFLPLLPAHSILEFSQKHSPGFGGNTKERRTRVKRIIAAGKALASVAMVDQKIVSFDLNTKRFIIGTQPQVPENSLPNSYIASSHSPATEQEVGENAQLIFEGEDEDDEEIVFRPVLVEKTIDTVRSTQNAIEVPERRRSAPPVTNDRFHQVSSEFNIPISGNIPLQVHPERDLHNSTWLSEQQASIADGIKKLRFVENEVVPAFNMKGNLGVHNHNAGSLFPMNTSMYSDYKRTPEVFIPSNVNSAAFPEVTAESFVAKPPIISKTFKSQAGRPVRHLGPPPGFGHVPPKSFNMQVSNVGGTNGSVVVDDYRWLDGFQNPSSSSSLGPTYATNQISSGINPAFSYSGGSNEHSGLAFSGMQSSGVQFQGGYPSFQNMPLAHVQKLPEQRMMPGNNQFSSPTEHYQGNPTWNGHYRV
ncbi:hypothetical protein RND81_04G239800 [Saponaria officinalis]|uniref:Protein SMG7 n=1 Tax=Saponaria officinalis TaxID=3572 RepID=A0AAW1LPG4_SAPOF